MQRVLLVDDDPGVLFTLKELLIDRNHEVVTCSSGKDALRKLDGMDMVLSDLAMPQMDGMELLRAVHDRDPTLPFVLITAHGSERVAVEAIKAGAYDYLPKPFDIDEVAIVVERALEARRLRFANRRLAAEQSIGVRFVSQSPVMTRLLDAVSRIADKDVTVLVRGETGTGKELIASMLHAQSKRAGRPLVRFNCAAIPAELAEAELFGHGKGAYTGAQGARQGFFAQAHQGTLVLDEVGDIPLPLQAKLLRALQEGEIQPVGTGRVEKVDVRIIACTNRDLSADVKSGRFREDLFYRLAVVDLVVPPLREHREDIAPLALEFTRRYATKFGLEEVSLAPGFVKQLEQSEWPGNVRQLENYIARAVALGSGPIIESAELDSHHLNPTTESHPDVMEGEPRAPGSPLSLKEQVEAFERNLIARALTSTRGNQSEAARRLGVSRVTLIDKIKKYQLGSASQEPPSA